MYSLTYFHPRTRVLRSITTPVRVSAFDTFQAMRRMGFVCRLWHNGAPVRIA